MHSYNLATIILWSIFLLYWLISAQGVKKIVRRENQRNILVMAAAFAIFIYLQKNFLKFNITIQNEYLKTAGLILCTSGISLAIWARVHLGKNWSSQPSIQENHELITSGPYKFIRHPIYTGIAAAVLGSVLASGIAWFIVFAVFLFEFLRRIRVEERLMGEIFPKAYPEYKKRTKALIPFIW